MIETYYGQDHLTSLYNALQEKHRISLHCTLLYLQTTQLFTFNGIFDDFKGLSFYSMAQNLIGVPTLLSSFRYFCIELKKIYVRQSG